MIFGCDSAMSRVSSRDVESIAAKEINMPYQTWMMSLLGGLLLGATVAWAGDMMKHDMRHDRGMMHEDMKSMRSTDAMREKTKGRAMADSKMMDMAKQKKMDKESMSSDMRKDMKTMEKTGDMMR